MILTICAATIISPIRWYYTGRYDQGEENYALGSISRLSATDDDDNDYQTYLWTYVVFTYVFTFLTAFVMMKQTIRVLQVRQQYLGQQNSITDRTIKLSGIPPELRTETALKDHIESLGIGSVRNLNLCRDWGTLDRMFDERKKLIRKLERAWAKYLGPTWIKKSDARSNNLLPFAADHHVSAHSLPLEGHEGAPLISNSEENLSQLAATNATVQRGGVT